MMRSASEHDSTGRGLMIVQAVSSRWGYEDHEGGKQVWAEIRNGSGPED